MQTAKAWIAFNYRSPFCALIVDRLLTISDRLGVDVEWRLLPEVPRPSSLPVTESNPRFAYNRQDCARRANWMGVKWNPPSWRLRDVWEASRIGLWLQRNAPHLFADYTLAASRAYWSDGRDLSEPEVVHQIALACGVKADALARIADEAAALDEELHANMRWAEQNALLGVPFFRYGEHGFWGSDRLEDFERYILESNGEANAIQMVGADHYFNHTQVPLLPVEGAGAAHIRRIFCVGRNYADHVAEMGKDPKSDPPFYFTKSLDALTFSGARIAYPPATENYQYEVELVALIGRAGFEIPAEDATNYICGYGVGLDMTRRDLQLAARDKGRPWDLGKSFENSAVIGAIKPVEPGRIPPQGRMTLKVNGHVRQDVLLERMIWSVPELIANLSLYYALRPGDLIFTGTPAGVGAVKDGDVLEGEIEGIGKVKASIVPCPRSRASQKSTPIFVAEQDLESS